MYFFFFFFKCDDTVCVHSHWWIQRVSGVQSRRAAFVLQHQRAHSQQSVLQQSAERLRPQVSETLLRLWTSLCVEMQSWCRDASGAPGLASAHGVGMPAWWSTAGPRLSSTTAPSLPSAWARRISCGQSSLKTESRAHNPCFSLHGVAVKVFSF